MSQAGSFDTSSPPPGTVTEFVLDYGIDGGGNQVTPGNAFPSANVINLLGGPGVETYVDQQNSNNIYIALSYGCENTGQTVDAQVLDIECVELPAVAGTMMIETRVAAITSVGGSLSAGYFITACVRTDGATATVIGVPDKNVFEEGALSNANVTVVVAVNTVYIRVTGVLGYTIEWKEVTNGTFIEQ